MNEKEHQKTREVPTVLEDVPVIGIGNYHSVPKKQCITKLETSINVKGDTNKMQTNPLVNAEGDANNTPYESSLVDPLVNGEDDANNVPLESPLVNANDVTNKN